jgi:hypothetical protein
MGWTMGSGITIEITKINTTSKECSVRIKDDGIEVSKGNIGLELNPDGTANTAWIIDTAKGIVLSRRKEKAEQASINKITSTINTNSEE